VHLSRLPLLKRLIPSLRRRIAPLRWPGGWRIAKIDQALFLVNYASFTDRVMGFDRNWERAQLAFFLDNVKRRRCETFLDVGSHIGLYAILVARHTDCSRIVAFEPDSRVYEQLRANLLLNELSDRIETMPIALSDKTGSIPFFAETVFGSGKSRVAADGGISVASRRLDDVLAPTGRSIALKIDIEEHELAALSGMTNLLHLNDCFVQVECFDPHLATFAAAMAELGYTLVHEIAADRYFAKRAGP
jgi:FkbM family methyltransferase